jgi:hypothetical protein
VFSTRFQDALWLFFPALQTGLVYLMLRGGWHRRMPMFFSYNIFCAIKGLASFFVLHWMGYAPYFYLFFSTEPLVVLLTFANIYELFSAMFKQREGLKDFGTMLFRWAIVVMVLMGAVLTVSSAGRSTDQFIKAVLSLERSIQLIMVGLLLFLIVFCRHLGISRRHRVFGIILGWSVTAAVELTLFVGHTTFNLSRETFNNIHLGVLDVMALIWLFYAVIPEPVEVLPNMLLRSQRWNDALLENPQIESQPLLHGIESLVDQAMTRNSK